MECPYCKEKLMTISGIQVHEIPNKDCALLGSANVICKRNILEDKEYLEAYLKDTNAKAN